MSEAAFVALAAGQAGGSYLKARGILNEAEAQADAARWNAEMAERTAKVEASRRRRAARRELATRRSVIAKSGVLAEGSPLEVLAENAAEFEIEALQSEWQGRVTSAVERSRARNIKRAGREAYYAELLGGAAGAGGTLYSGFKGK